MTARLLALIGIIPVIVFAFWTTAGAVQVMMDPCASWGQRTGMTSNIEPGAPCIEHGRGISQTRTQAVIGLITIQGGLLFASCVGLIGVYRSFSRLTLLASAMLVFRSVPLIVSVFAVLPLLAATCLLLSHFLARVPRRE